RKADQIGMEYEKISSDGISAIAESEQALIILLNDFKEKIRQAGKEYSPAVVAQYLFDLAKEYNRFYAELPIFNESDDQMQTFRIALSAQVAKTIKAGMKLLGIEVPDKM